jgi:hypothetical protein
MIRTYFLSIYVRNALKDKHDLLTSSRPRTGTPCTATMRAFGATPARAAGPYKKTRLSRV